MAVTLLPSDLVERGSATELCQPRHLARLFRGFACELSEGMLEQHLQTPA